MFSRLAAAVTLLAVVAGALGQALTINTPYVHRPCPPWLICSHTRHSLSSSVVQCRMDYLFVYLPNIPDLLV